MCLPKAPKPDKTAEAQSKADSIEATRQRQQAELDAAAVRADNKEARTEDKLAQLSGKIGRKSLFSGEQGGVGFPGMRRRMTGPGATPNRPTPAPPVPTGGPSSTGGSGTGGGGGFNGAARRFIQRVR